MASSAWLRLKTLFFTLVLLTLTETNEEAERGTNNSNNNNGKIRFVRYLDEESYQQFINTSNVEIVYFQKKDSRRVQTFLREYENSAERLLAFGIYLGLIDCQQVPISNYCKNDRSLHYAFGFRNGIEKISLPLDTLFDVDSIVASALHLSLIHNVPIIQTLSERKALERKCKGRYDIVFSYQKALGTYEHRVFMELAYTFLDKYVFAMTISERAVQDLRHFSEETLKSFNDPDYNSHIEPTLWILYCQSITDHKDECSQNFYYGRFHYLDVFHFVQSLDAPQWVEFPNQNMEEKIPYNLSEIHLLYILVNDEDQLESRISTYKHLGQMFAGSVGLLYVRIAKISDDGLAKLNLPARDDITLKSNFAWKTKGQMTLTWKQDCDGLQQFILGHLRAESNQVEDPNKQESGFKNRNWDSNGEEYFDELSELQQDDMVAEYVRLFVSKDSQILELTEADYSFNLHNQNLTLVLFYVKWDPNCQVTIQTLVEIQNHFKIYESNSSSQLLICKLDCFDWPKLCQNNNINIYPTIRIFDLENNRSVIYQDIIQKESIITALNMFKVENPLLLQSEENALNLINGNWSSVLPTFIKLDYIILMGFSSSQKNEGKLLATNLTNWLIGKALVSYVIDDLAHNIVEHFTADLPFLVLVKSNDPFKPIIVYDKGKSILDKNFNLEDLKIFIEKNSLNSFAQLTPANFPLYRQQTDKDLVIYFENLKVDTHDDIWAFIGKLTTSEKYSHILFTWMKIKDSLAEALMNFYKLKPFETAIVRIFFEKGTYSSIQGEYLKPPEVIEQWLDDFSQFNTTNTDQLLIGDWKPLHPGFDYLRLIDEDIRNLDENDSLQMSIEINSRSIKNIKDSDDGFKDSRKLLRVPIKSKNSLKLETKKLNNNGKENQLIRNEL